jgi:hypothetical protein
MPDFYARPHSYKFNVRAVHIGSDTGDHNSAQVDLIQSGTTIHTAPASKFTPNNLLAVITHLRTTCAATGGERQYDRTFWALRCVCCVTRGCYNKGVRDTQLGHTTRPTNLAYRSASVGLHKHKLNTLYWNSKWTPHELRDRECGSKSLQLTSELRFPQRWLWRICLLTSGTSLCGVSYKFTDDSEECAARNEVVRRASNLSGLSFNSEGEGSTLLRNVCKFLPNLTALHPRRRCVYSSLAHPATNFLFIILLPNTCQWTPCQDVTLSLHVNIFISKIRLILSSRLCLQPWNDAFSLVSLIPTRIICISLMSHWFSHPNTTMKILDIIHRPFFSSNSAFRRIDSVSVFGWSLLSWSIK